MEHLRNVHFIIKTVKSYTENVEKNIKDKIIGEGMMAHMHIIQRQASLPQRLGTQPLGQGS